MGRRAGRSAGRRRAPADPSRMGLRDEPSPGRELRGPPVARYHRRRPRASERAVASGQAGRGPRRGAGRVAGGAVCEGPRARHRLAGRRARNLFVPRLHRPPRGVVLARGAGQGARRGPRPRSSPRADPVPDRAGPGHPADSQGTRTRARRMDGRRRLEFHSCPDGGIAMKALRLVLLVVVAGGSTMLAASCSSSPQTMAPSGDELFRDDFSRFPIGMLSAPLGLINPAIQEYHWLEKRGVSLDPWENAIIYLDPWTVGEEDGKPYLEMHLSSSNRYMETSLLAPSFITGDVEWRDCTVEALVRPLSFDETAGLVFRYQTNRHQYIFVMEKGKQVRLAVRQRIEPRFCRVGVKDLGSADFA